MIKFNHFSGKHRWKILCPNLLNPFFVLFIFSRMLSHFHSLVEYYYNVFHIEVIRFMLWSHALLTYFGWVSRGENFQTFPYPSWNLLRYPHVFRFFNWHVAIFLKFLFLLYIVILWNCLGALRKTIQFVESALWFRFNYSCLEDTLWNLLSPLNYVKWNKYPVDLVQWHMRNVHIMMNGILIRDIYCIYQS